MANFDVKISTPTCTPLKKSAPFFNLTLYCLLNLEIKNITSVQILAPGVNKSPKELLIWAHLF
jgi:hypothetical protein